VCGYSCDYHEQGFSVQAPGEAGSAWILAGLLALGSVVAYGCPLCLLGRGKPATEELMVELVETRSYKGSES
jgi:hypothetical protein